MRRRGLIHAGAAAMIWSSSAGAQQGPIPRIGCLFTRANYGESFNTLRRGLRDLGYVEGKNILLDVRSSDGNNGRLPELATELVSFKPAVIVSNGPFAIRAVKDAAGTIPIVMSVIDDPVGLGFAQSLAHPGGNLTGLSNLAEGLVSKRLEMLLEVAPDPGCVAVLHDQGEPADEPLYWQEIFAAARTLHTASSRFASAVRTNCQPRFHRFRRSIARPLW
jgi:putative ABC transport system substrate-binding protein